MSGEDAVKHSVTVRLLELIEARLAASSRDEMGYAGLKNEIAKRLGPAQLRASFDNRGLDD